MTPLEKAEAVLASFRDEVECSRCHQYIKRTSLMAVWTMDIDDSEFIQLSCQACWFDTLDAADQLLYQIQMTKEQRYLVDLAAKS